MAALFYLHVEAALFLHLKVFVGPELVISTYFQMEASMKAHVNISIGLFTAQGTLLG